MGKRRTNNLNVLYGLLALVVLLQAVAIGLVIRFEAVKEKRDVALLDRTALMLNDIFPGIRQDLSVISEKASEIKKEVLDVQDSVSRVDERVGQVGQDVVGVGGQMDGLNRKVTGFFQDRSGLIWGHSLNPYVLAGLLLLVLLSVPVSGWVFTRKHRSPAPARKDIVIVSRTEGHPASSGCPEGFSTRQGTNGYAEVGPELRKIMEQTERLIDHVRSDGTRARRQFKQDSNREPVNPDMLH